MRKLCLFLWFALLGLTGCNGIHQTENVEESAPENTEIIVEYAQEVQEVKGAERTEKAENIAKNILAFYRQSEKENTAISLGEMQNLVNQLGEQGYVAIDSRNQIDMANPEQVIRFCEAVDREEAAELIITEIFYTGDFTEYEMHTKGGEVEVIRTNYKYENDTVKNVASGDFVVDDWRYTEEGYLMFSGVWISEDMYILTMSGVEENKAFRVQPLDKRCRELNRQYLMPIGYAQNNMFLVEWNEDYLEELNFYDLYDIFYRRIYGHAVPYSSDDNLNIGAVYHIPRDNFENVITQFISIDSSKLQTLTDYDAEHGTYEYRPRGFYEMEYPEYPYPEVVDFKENGDGTITLMVNVVYPEGGSSKFYSHEVVVRPLEKDGVQYVSNHIMSPDDTWEPTWHTARLTKEEWIQVYEKAD